MVDPTGDEGGLARSWRRGDERQAMIELRAVVQSVNEAWACDQMSARAWDVELGREKLIGHGCTLLMAARC